MKTKYVMPTVQVVKITTGATMITGSNGQQMLRDGGNTNTAGISEGSARSARFSSWDEDDFEEE